MDITTYENMAWSANPARSPWLANVIWLIASENSSSLGISVVPVLDYNSSSVRLGILVGIVYD